MGLMNISLHQEAVHGIGGTAPCGDGLDDGCRTSDTVTAGKDIGLRGLGGLAVNLDVAPLIQLNGQVIVKELCIGALTNSTDNGISFYLKVAAFNGNRTATA